MRRFFGRVLLLIVGAVVGAGAVVVYLFPPSGLSSYRSTCVVKASVSEVAGRYAGGDAGARESNIAVIKEEMLRYDRVMSALANTEIMVELEAKAKGNPELRGRLEEDLYQSVVKNTRFKAIGPTLVQVSYFGETRDHALTVLSRLANTFVEKAMAEERDDARRARELAFKELNDTKAELESLENKLVTFREEHPGVSDGGKREEFANVLKRLEDITLDITGKQRKQDVWANQIELVRSEMPKEVKEAAASEVELRRSQLIELQRQLEEALTAKTPATPDIKEWKERIVAAKQALAEAEEAVRQSQIIRELKVRIRELEDKRLELAADIKYQMEWLRSLQLRKTRLEEEVHALPALQRELARQERNRQSAERRYEQARETFERVDRDFEMKMEGLVSFSIVSPPRKPHEKELLRWR